MEIRLESAHFENFKGLKDVTVNFSDKTFICGQNASGKTSIFDGVTWILFDKNSQFDSKFEVRELDENGNKVHFTEILGTLVLTADGQQYELTKVQKEKWVKKRGQEQQEFSGNQNNYSVNGFPKSEKEYKAFISELISEDVFRMLTSPTAFTALDWKAQRKILMSLLDDIPEEEIAKAVDDYDLIAADIAVASPDDCRLKYSKSKKALNDKLDQLPIRIDELEKQKVDVDTAHLTAERDRLTEVIEQTEEFVRNNRIPDESDFRNEIAKLRTEQDALSKSANAEIEQKRAVLKEQIADLRSEQYEALASLDKWKQAVCDANDGMKACEDDGKRFKAEFDAKQEEFQTEKLKLYPSENDYCPTCGQVLPEEGWKAAREKWEDERNERLRLINVAGANALKGMRACEASMKEWKLAVAKAHESMKEVNSKAVDVENRLEAKQAELDAMQSIIGIDVSGTDEYKALAVKITEAEANIVKVSALRAERTNLIADLNQYKRDRDAVLEQLSAVKHNERIDAQIAEYRKELHDVRIKVAKMAQLLDVLGEYVKFLANRINDQFTGLTFKLFENQINGGIRECCEISYDGVPYSSLNSGHRIVVGLQIIKVLQEVYGSKSFIFIDNAETVNEQNVPDMDCQMVFLKVTDDRKLVIS